MGSSENVDSGKVIGQKSQFTQTCNRLSQFLKKKGSVGDLNNLGIYRTTFETNGSQQTAATTTTMNLLPMIEKSSDSSSSSVETNPQKPMNLFPQEFDFCKEQSTKKTESWKSDQPEKAQMTIFYGGQVIVFDDFPADKANEIMKLANKQNPTNNFTYIMMKNQKPADQSATNFGNNLIQELPKCRVPIPQPSVADLPIARRNSLTRFLEKRKDRITAIAPYQISSNKKIANSKNEENKAWLGLGAQFVKTEQYF
ncbi:protein TIFY 10A-like [Solanum dulcamara]|uniref:protein TIFY 10A-like n=1 Tax=Solanum dulcamara TaxID=45834 RepID=UPI002485B2EA|nr:protein TIFY 10A-like [Solanum dulcamara]